MLARHGKPIAQLVPLDPSPRRQLGFLEGHVDDDFFEPLPDEELERWAHEAAVRHSCAAVGSAETTKTLPGVTSLPGEQRQLTGCQRCIRLGNCDQVETWKTASRSIRR